MAAHLLVINTNLLMNLTTYFKADQNELLQISLAVLFSIMYSFGTVYTLDRPGAVLLKVFFALLDGVAVGLWYNSTLRGVNFVWFVSSFYVVYTISVALGVGIKPKTNKSKFESNKSKFEKLFACGFLLYMKGKLRKSKSDELLAIANDFELLLGNFDLDLDYETVTNLFEVNKEIERIVKK